MHKPRVKLEKACAKINLTLEVLGRRDDGYHEIAGVMQAIDLCDTLHFGLEDHIHLACNVPQLVSPNNLVFKAVRLLQDATGSRLGISVSLEKGIPLASGLGGGSSDAAVTLQAVNELWELNLSREELRDIAFSLGSDVPFFLCDGTTALVQGRGERVTRLPRLVKTWVVLVKPPIEIANKTQEMYARLRPSHFSDGGYTRRMVEVIKKRETIKAEMCHNVFYDIAFASLPGLDGYRLRFLAAGAPQVYLAGSGPALFSLVEGRAQGEDIYRRLKQDKVEVYLAETI
jgi:4-diphosphocytidyl-2-C-methyl-D-erythritol kinase